jgi:DNA-binding NarL/FixJ family response regulator
MKILIADDHEIVRRGLCSLLGDALPEAQLVEASDGLAALAQLDAEPFDLAVLDLNMPGMSGLDVLEASRRQHPGTAVIVLTVFSEDAHAVRAYSLGAAAYLTKNQAADELLAAVRKVLAGGRYVSPATAERLAAALGGDLVSTPHEALSTRELQVLKMVAIGLSQKEIAASLGLSEKTISTYRARIAEKSGLLSSVDIARYALKAGLVD